MSKISYATYIKDRLTGFDGDPSRRPPTDLELFPNFLKCQASAAGAPTCRRPKCVSEIKVKGLEPLKDDLAAFQTVPDANGYAEGFMNSATPGVIALFQPNEFYQSQDDYLEAVTEGMRIEYAAIVEAGFILQIDAPDLGFGRHIEVMNNALRNVPGDKVRMHVCDIALRKILPALLQAKLRHAHEWVDWKNDDLSDDYVLTSNVIDSTSNFLEHPELIAQRPKNYVDIVGPEWTIAGTGCGFSPFAGFGAVAPDIVWAKLKALSDGAEIASRH